jgi:hypothetical protein
MVPPPVLWGLRMDHDAIIDRLMQLFTSRDGVRGDYWLKPDTPKGAKKKGEGCTVKEQITREHWIEHLTGKSDRRPFKPGYIYQGLGGVPICDDQMCRFGAIDIDKYPDDAAGPLNPEECCADIQAQGLPLVVTRSKSGGLHYWVFFAQPQRADHLQDELERYSNALGFPGQEIFPKQRVITPDGAGNWINFPWFAAFTEEGSTRHGYDIEGNPIHRVDEWLRYVDDHLLVPKTFADVDLPDDADVPFSDGPPCLQGLTKHGFPEGSRNNALFSVGVYLRNKYPDEWETKIEEFNLKHMQPPLDSKSVQTVIKSLRKSTYHYRCNDIPLRNACKRDVCLRRQFGVGGNAGGGGAAVMGQGMPRVDEVIQKHVTTDAAGYETEDPPTWVMTIEGVEIPFSTSELMDQGRWRRKVVERINRVAPRLNAAQWDAFISARVERAETVVLPPDAGATGQFIEYVREFTLTMGVTDSRDRRDVLDDKAILEEKQWHFTGNALRKFLAQRRFAKAEDGSWIFRTLRTHLRAENKAWRLGNNTVHKVWFMPDWGASFEGKEPRTPDAPY